MRRGGGRGVVWRRGTRTWGVAGLSVRRGAVTSWATVQHQVQQSTTRNGEVRTTLCPNPICTGRRGRKQKHDRSRVSHGPFLTHTHSCSLSFTDSLAHALSLSLSLAIAFSLSSSLDLGGAHISCLAKLTATANHIPDQAGTEVMSLDSAWKTTLLAKLNVAAAAAVTGCTRTATSTVVAAVSMRYLFASLSDRPAVRNNVNSAKNT
mmetsp:Transcript_27418/g.85055  ORF Transcript_27418/g.85055 Transcript_27418/m.85055 type:complete len:207 (+) Transcript_27418:135-755(+)